MLPNLSALHLETRPAPSTDAQNQTWWEWLRGVGGEIEPPNDAYPFVMPDRPSYGVTSEEYFAKRDAFDRVFAFLKNAIGDFYADYAYRINTAVKRMRQITQEDYKRIAARQKNIRSLFDQARTLLEGRGGLRVVTERTSPASEDYQARHTYYHDMYTMLCYYYQTYWGHIRYVVPEKLLEYQLPPLSLDSVPPWFTCLRRQPDHAPPPQMEVPPFNRPEREDRDYRGYRR